MKVINLFGEPSAGKTATMLTLAGKMKKMGLSVDIASEAYKELVYENTPGDNFDNVNQIAENTQNQVVKFGGQLYILAEQNKRLARLNGTVDFAITDCPLPLIAFYTPKNYINGFEDLALNLFKTYDNHNFYIRRNHDFETKARVHNEAQSLEIADKLPIYLEKFIGKKFSNVFTGDFTEDEIISNLVANKMLNLPKKAKLKK